MIDVRIRIIAHNMQSNYVTGLSNEINPCRDKQIIGCCWAFILDRVFNELHQDY